MKCSCLDAEAPGEGMSGDERGDLGVGGRQQSRGGHTASPPRVSTRLSSPGQKQETCQTHLGKRAKGQEPRCTHAHNTQAHNTHVHSHTHAHRATYTPPQALSHAHGY